MEKIFGKFEAKTEVTDELPEVDVLTKGRFFHSEYVNACIAFLQEKGFLYLCGARGAGKTTIVENLCARAFEETVLRWDCRADANELEFMEAVLRNLRIPPTLNRELKPWRDILGSAIPSLRWPTPHRDETLAPATVTSAFKRVLAATEKVPVILIEDLHRAPDSLLNFIQQLVQMVANRTRPGLNLILTSVGPVSGFDIAANPIPVPFPDVVDLCAYVSVQFNQCRTPLELVESLCDAAGRNLGEFIKLVGNAKANGQLVVDGGVLSLAPEVGSPEALQPSIERSTVPQQLRNFSEQQIEFLEWIALCPEVDVNTLKRVTRAGIDALGEAIDKAGEMDLFGFQSNTSDGFHWREEAVREYLVSGLSQEEQKRRFLKLATTIEKESRTYLPYSPPLWLVLCRLYQNAKEGEQAAKYALDYARYCSQTANYEPIRNILTPFIDSSEFQGDQEFWCLLAMANVHEDLDKALSYADRALEIRENVEVLSLRSILLFQAGDPNQARQHLEAIFSGKQLGKIDIQYAAQLMPILVALNRQDWASDLFASMRAKLKGRNDLFATNTLLLAEMELLTPWPKKIIAAVRSLKQELLPATEHQLAVWRSRAHQDRFDFPSALAALKVLEERHEPRLYQEILFLYINFDKHTHIRKLSSRFREDAARNNRLKQSTPLYQLATEWLVQDPKITDFEHVVRLLDEARVDRSCWLALLASAMKQGFHEVSFLEQTVAELQVAATPWARHQMLRLHILLAFLRGEPDDCRKLMAEAVYHAREHGLVMEALRLHALKGMLEQGGKSLEGLNFGLDSSVLNHPETRRFLNLQLTGI
jgi:hypothetical protein